MINSVNALEFLKPKLLTMDKYNSTPTTKLLPSSSLTQTRTFTAVSGKQNVSTIDTFEENKSQILLNDEIKDHDRVKVQHLENHTKLQNNKCWNNFRTLYNISASSNVMDRDMTQMSQMKDDKEILDVVNVGNSSSTTITPLNIQNKSAFNLDLNSKHHNNIGISGNHNYIGKMKNYTSKIPESNNNCRAYCKQYNNCDLTNKQPLTTAMIVMSTEPGKIITNDSQNAEDRNDAFRHIESVHNYAKSKLFEGEDDYKTSPNGSRHSSFLDDDDDDEDDEEEGEDNDDDAEYDNDDDIDYEGRLPDLDADYEDILIKRRYNRFQKHPTLSDGALCNKANKSISSKGAVNKLKKTACQSIKVNKCYEDEEGHIDVDVETIETPTTPVSETNSLAANNDIAEESGKPDHHARRPMNAFLIFCKRHRAIVKERYKNLENRAITKILGDWWASLEENDKKCFTNLAQQNKDAFFSANPNFKWYKLPAPPLRSLTTRPANNDGDNNANNAFEMISNISRNNSNHSNYFKLADEAQMGDLSQLINDKSNTTKQCVDLQQVLGETSQFLSAHITGSSETMEENHLKRRFHNENSFSSNSSEEDIKEPKNKSARSCKGKRYQELINSGQIATAFKKSKTSTRQVSGDGGANSEMNVKQSFTNCTDNVVSNSACKKRPFSESENVMSYDLRAFDLEEKIKELPALNLDDYLQRKRNTKKKKKFSSSGKKRGQRSSTNNNNNRNNSATNRTDNDNLNVKSNESLQPHQYHHVSKQQQQAATAVGSQKRKARKESITRRDVSAIEQEVASLLPLTINGCCYFQEAPLEIKIENIEENAASSQSPTITSISSIIPFTQNSSSSVSVDVLNNTNVSNNTSNDNISSSTSDLLILAEVAANHTEIKEELLE